MKFYFSLTKLQNYMIQKIINHRNMYFGLHTIFFIWTVQFSLRTMCLNYTLLTQFVLRIFQF